METPDKSIEQIGLRLRDVRLERGISQVVLGDMSGSNQTVIQKIENGRSIRPRCIMEIAEALGVNPAWLQFGEPWARKESPIGPDWMVKEKPATSAG